MADRSDGIGADPTGPDPVPGGPRVPSGGEASDPSEPPHSALVGYMSVPVHRRLPIRRSTLLMVVAFVGFGTLLYFNPASSSASPSGAGTVVRTADGDFFVPNATKVAPPTTTTSTVPSTPTTVSRPPSATTPPSPTTTAAPRPPGSTPGTTVGGTSATTSTTSPAPASGAGAGTTTTSTSGP